MLASNRIKLRSNYSIRNFELLCLFDRQTDTPEKHTTLAVQVVKFVLLNRYRYADCDHFLCFCTEHDPGVQDNKASSADTDSNSYMFTSHNTTQHPRCSDSDPQDPGTVHESTNLPRPLRRPFVCKVCGRKYVYRGGLKRHMLNHGTEQPYSCYLCSKTFVDSAQLKGHIRLHSSERPFVCTVCKQESLANANVKRATAVHV